MNSASFLAAASRSKNGSTPNLQHNRGGFELLQPWDSSCWPHCATSKQVHGVMTWVWGLTDLLGRTAADCTEKNTMEN